MADWNNWIGLTRMAKDILTPGLLTRFQATIDQQRQGHLAPQGVHWCLCLPNEPMSSLGDDGHPRRSGTVESFMPPVPFPRRMWASSDIQFLAPIGTGATIRRVSKITSITEKTGSTGNLVFVEVSHTTHADHCIAVEEKQTIVYRETNAAMAPPSTTTKLADFNDWEWYGQACPSAAMTFRYSALTFNSHRIHYDWPYATGIESYRGVVIQGPLIATLLLDLAARNVGENTLKSFKFRALSPAFAEETLHLVGKANGNAVSFAALAGDERPIMTATGTI